MRILSLTHDDNKELTGHNPFGMLAIRLTNLRPECGG